MHASYFFAYQFIDAYENEYVRKYWNFKLLKMNILKCFVCFVWFYGISTIGGYLMPNPFLYI